MITKWDSNKTGTMWLHNKLEANKKKTNYDIYYPLKTNGSQFELEDLLPDQTEIATYILKKLKQWIEYNSSEQKELPFKPLQMTVIGAAGTGKSVLINTIVTVVCDIFGFTEAVQVFGPTGCAAYNAGGETVHYGCKVPVKITGKGMDNDLSEDAKKFLMEKFKRVLMLLFDEQSMLALKTIGYAASNIAKTAHGGWHEHELFAGISIIILLGYDYQLPAQMSKGAFNILHSADYTPMEIYGRQVMLECSTDVMELAKKMHQCKFRIIYIYIYTFQLYNIYLNLP